MDAADNAAAAVSIALGECIVVVESILSRSSSACNSLGGANENIHHTTLVFLIAV